MQSNKDKALELAEKEAAKKAAEKAREREAFYATGHR